MEEHQAYQDCHQQARDWMHATMDKVAVCAEGGGDKQAMQNRLDRLQVRREKVSDSKQVV